MGFMGSTGDTTTQGTWESSKTPGGRIPYCYTRSGPEETLAVTVPLRPQCESRENKQSGIYPHQDIYGLPLLGGTVDMFQAISDGTNDESYTDSKTLEVPNVPICGKNCKKFNPHWDRLPLEVSQEINTMGDCTAIEVESLELSDTAEEEYIPVIYHFKRTLEGPAEIKSMGDYTGLDVESIEPFNSAQEGCIPVTDMFKPVLGDPDFDRDWVVVSGADQEEDVL
ncbi:hypothetical protein I302_100475 [Kwoniella bestiolae CBS 10118]|uniref:Uncharacterized protein n=1 Tax=Kwoniella bestiolae CBS 10118 TaxID=1296100 RepID=A0A1B9G591_9TREE|nr:hypothetical protein I302_03848 [Kwoniella bestiolae CBS 10118]OCF26170.1 hypothetical protein I302_03848 [Kwoniella bestiolae CBS 10118]